MRQEANAADGALGNMAKIDVCPGDDLRTFYPS